MSNLYIFPDRPRLIEPMCNAYGHEPVKTPQGEPAPAFEVDRDRKSVVWTLNGLRLVHPPQFRALADLFAGNGWFRNLNALLDAELALSEPPGAA